MRRPGLAIACVDDSECDDGLACNGVETCNLGTSMCDPGTGPDCSSFTDQCNVGVCVEPAGTCAADPVGDGTPCNSGDVCTIPDSCQAGVCAAGGGGDGDGDGICDADDNCPAVANNGQQDVDADDLGDPCDDNDRVLNVVVAKLKRKPAPSIIRGAIILKGDFLVTPPEQPFSASGGITVRVREDVGLDMTFSWTGAQCVTNPKGRIKCLSADNAQKAILRPFSGSPGTFKYQIRLTRLDITGPFFIPVDVTMTNQPGILVQGIDRVGDIVDCKQTPRGMTCRE